MAVLGLTSGIEVSLDPMSSVLTMVDRRCLHSRMKQMSVEGEREQRSGLSRGSRGVQHFQSDALVVVSSKSRLFNIATRKHGHVGYIRRSKHPCSGLKLEG